MKPSEIKAALVEKEIKQADIARQTGHSGSYVNDVINGNRRSPVIERAIAEAIGVAASEVFPIEQQATAPAA